VSENPPPFNGNERPSPSTLTVPVDTPGTVKVADVVPLVIPTARTSITPSAAFSVASTRVAAVTCNPVGDGASSASAIDWICASC
jgi:hypothetical protein